MDEPDRDSVEEPTQTQRDAEAATSFMAKQWASIALISIAAMALFALGLMQATGLIDLLGSDVGIELYHWVALLALVVVAVAAFAWSRRGV